MAEERRWLVVGAEGAVVFHIPLERGHADRRHKVHGSFWMVPRGVRGVFTQLIDVERHRDVADRRKADLQQCAGLRENRQHPDFGMDSEHGGYQHVIGERHGVWVRRVPSGLDSISWISRRWNTTSYSVGYSSEQSKLTLMINNLYSLDISESGLALYRNDGSSWTKVWQK